MLTKIERTQKIEELENEFKEARGIYLTDNNRITVAQVTKLRSDIRKKGMRFVVVKNSLAKAAAKRCGKDSIESYFKGPTAVVLARDNAAAPAKTIKDFQKDHKDLLTVKAAYVDGALFNSAQVLQLADLPSREVLLAQFLGCLKQPASNLAGVLSSIITKFARTLDALKEKKGIAA